MLCKLQRIKEKSKEIKFFIDYPNYSSRLKLLLHILLNEV